MNKPQPAPFNAGAGRAGGTPGKNRSLRAFPGGRAVPGEAETAGLAEDPRGPEAGCPGSRAPPVWAAGPRGLAEAAGPPDGGAASAGKIWEMKRAWKSLLFSQSMRYCREGAGDSRLSASASFPFPKEKKDIRRDQQAKDGAGPPVEAQLNEYLGENGVPFRQFTPENGERNGGNQAQG